MNTSKQAIAIFSTEMGREEKRKKLIRMINDIKPVKLKYDSVELTRAIRDHKLNEFTYGKY